MMINPFSTTQQFINSNPHPDYRPDIDGLRAIAVASVVFYHAFPEYLKGGFIGVDIFFVISGFLISSNIFSNLNRNEFSFIDFYSRRIRRIFPALIVILVFCLIFGWFALLADEYKMLGKHVAGGAGFISNFIFWKEVNYFDVASDKKQLLHLWSLGVEEQFYIFWPIFLWLAWKMRVNFLSMMILFSAISFILNVKNIHHDTTATFYSPQTRFWELLAGAFLAYFKTNNIKFEKIRVFNQRYLALSTITINNIKSSAGMLLIIIGLFKITNQKYFPGWWAILPIAGAILIISSGYQTWFNRIILSNRILVWIGLISFPLYLWHWPLLSFSRVMQGETPTIGIRVGAIIIATILAWVTYYFIERPIRFFATEPKTKNHITIILACLMLVIGYIGFNIFSRDGLAFRHKSLSQIQSQRDIEAKNYSNQNCRLMHPDFAGYYCVKLKPIEPTILILGDSHANRLYTGLTENLFAETANVLNFGHHYCAPFLNVSSEGKTPASECSIYAKYGLDIAKNKESINTIILLFRGTLYVNDSANNQQFEKNMRQSLAELSITNKKVIFVLDNPELDFDPQSCLDTRPLRLTNRVKQPCAITQEKFLSVQHRYRELVFRVLKDFPKIHALDSSNNLCDGKLCWAMKNQKLLYSDSDHLSVEGSRYLALDLMKLINP